MKKIIISFTVVIIFFGNINSFVYADDSSSSSSSEEDWVSQAFSAAYEFLNEGVTSDETVIGDAIDNLLDFFTDVVRALNIILLTALAGISMIALSVVGIRYIASGVDPKQRKEAIDGLHTVFRGMLYGFGAYTIWNIAMAVVRIVIKSFA